MKKRRDIRIGSLLMTIVLISIVAVLVQRIPDQAQVVISSEPAFDESQHVQQQKHNEVAARFEQAVIMLHAQEYDYAITALHRVLKLTPTMPEAHVNMGYALLGSNNPEAAHDFFQSAIALRPTQANAYWGLAVSLEALCDMAGAKGAMRTYLHLASPDDKFVTRARAALWEWDTADKSTGSSC
ncbi:MAG: hypothetical protein AMJ53_02390 [Gammaproteobacteria bacterium SG8_11]|jgi:Flp pilus assembly protein TadD|nr:MAG: hypothetical protein AMJ53_02390 [Gammaproteobacteria bacterium SG8_11]